MTGVVVDSNLYISALIFGGLPQRLLDLLHARGTRLYISKLIIEEVSGTLTGKFRWTKQEAETFLPPLWEGCTLIRSTARLKVCADPEDDHVLECAVSAGADYIVTGNLKHFPAEYRGIRAVTARQMIELLTDGGE